MSILIKYKKKDFADGVTGKSYYTAIKMTGGVVFMWNFSLLKRHGQLRGPLGHDV